MVSDVMPEASLPVSPEGRDPSNLPFPVVGIGASAGGMLAIQQFLEQMPTDSGMAFVVVLHLSPKHESHADRILQRVTRMPVTEVTEATPIEPNHVYVISPRLDLSMEDGHLLVAPSRRPRGTLVAIDLFFRTLAETHRDRSVGIVMSGTGADGTLGVASLKEQGGVTFAQLPVDAEFDDMPKSAIASGHVDFVLSAVEMPRRLVDLWNNAREIQLPDARAMQPPMAADDDARPSSEAALHDIIAILAARTGHDFSNYKRATMLRRIERRMQVRLLKDLPAYRDYLRSHLDESGALLADMLISVTNFFRDPEAYEALEKLVIPGLFESRDPSEPVRVWVAGCATGEEAYSLAMMLQDEATRRDAGHQFQIFATDIDEQAIATARYALYRPSIVADVSPVRLRTYFTQEDGSYRIRKSLRERVLFAAHNTLRDPPYSRLDLVSCRNVLIYLERDIQRKLLHLFHYSLRDDGVLFLGGSESADSADEMFGIVDKRHRIFRASISEKKRTFRLPLRISLQQPRVPAVRNVPPEPSATAIHQRVLEQYAPPSVIIDGDGNVVHMSEQVGRFMHVPAGVPSRQLAALVRPELQRELRSALFQARHTHRSVEAKRVRFHRDGRLYYLNMIARPFNEPDSGLAHTLVLFEEVDETMSLDEASAPAEADRQSIVLLLEQELQLTKDQLQTTLELSDTSTEELKASNEELQSINEELRSTSEELETSTEELQSVNEELITVNAELKTKVDDAEHANVDLKNFIAATDVATIFVDQTLAVVRYTPQAELIYSLIPTDIGRPLTDITHRLDYPAIAADVAAAMATQRVIEREVQSMDGRWWIVRVRPHYAAGGRGAGALLTFVDITGLRIAHESAALGEEVRVALQQSKDFAVIMTDMSGAITGWNEGAERIFGYGPKDVTGLSIDLIFLPEDVAAGRPEFERSMARVSGRAEDDRWHLRRDGARIFVSGVMTPLTVGEHPGFVKIVRDVTAQQREMRLGQRELKRARARGDNAEAAIALKDEFLAVMSHELKHPLNLISVNAEILVRTGEAGVGRSDAASRALNTIVRAVRAQSKIIEDLLDLSRMRTGKLQVDRTAVDLVALIESATDAVKSDATATGVELAFRSREPHILVHADPARLNQIAWNLLGNALKFTPAGGRIDVEVVIDQGCGRIQVADSGSGIDPAHLPEIFEMFGQAHTRSSAPQGGLGIGLALVRQLAEHHGGRVEGHSDGLGKGARFSVWIPLYVETSIPASFDSPHAVDCCRDLKLMVVDDDPVTVDALATLLELEGAEVVRATSVDQAMALLEEAQPDLVVTDLNMPGMDGYALLLAIRARAVGARIPVIALTGFGRPDDMRRVTETGFDGHMTKPVDFPRLIRLISELTSARQETSREN